ncbi:type II toxin-antitoxin system VapC family toxin [uncultured Muribaculum sp.]|uniref:type II toxin-antitoxin system VapC family toxin n=1 Tax=uncultured Muribaculum sp. TaxID=1918613 RepID=UPI0026F3B4E7|nr:type II toxin-antitoxin system VapC family toxin [uncultured Muribaculum sp.]
MRILLDTHILLWALSNDAKLPEKARELIANEENEIYYSVISLLEVEIKHLAHPDIMPVSTEEISGYCEQSGYKQITIKENHIFTMKELKCEKNTPPHKNPFDWMLICQANAEKMVFITHVL